MPFTVLPYHIFAGVIHDLGKDRLPRGPIVVALGLHVTGVGQRHQLGILDVLLLRDAGQLGDLFVLVLDLVREHGRQFLAVGVQSLHGLLEFGGGRNLVGHLAQRAHRVGTGLHALGGGFGLGVPRLEEKRQPERLQTATGLLINFQCLLDKWFHNELLCAI